MVLKAKTTVEVALMDIIINKLLPGACKYFL